MPKFRVISKHPVSKKKKVYMIEAANEAAAMEAAEAKAPQDHEVYSAVPAPSRYVSPISMVAPGDENH